MFRVLVVDDEPQVRDLTSRALRRCDLACDTAADGDEAMHRCQSTAYNAVVTDLRMPRRHGHSLATELLGQSSPPKVVVVTGLAEPRLIRDLMGRGVEDVLHKPVNYDVLAMKVLALAEKDKRANNPSLAAPVGEAPSPTQVLAAIEKSLVELSEIFQESLTGLFELEEELSDPPRSVKEFIARFAQQEEAEAAAASKEGSEARLADRVRCNATALAVPVTRKFALCGEPFNVAIRDVSEGGIRLLHTRATDAQYLGLSWSAETLPASRLEVVAKITRCRPLSPFYDIGAQFVMAD